MLNLKSQLRKLCERELKNIGESVDFFMDRKSDGLYAAWFAAEEKMICVFIEYRVPGRKMYYKFFAPVPV